MNARQKSISVALPPVGARCQTPATLQPCGKPAMRLAWMGRNRVVARPLCLTCATAAIAEGVALVEQGEKYTLEPLVKPVKAKPVDSGVEQAGKAPAMPNTTDPALLVDIEANQVDQPTDEDRRKVSTLAREAMACEDEIARLAALMKTQQERLDAICNVELPAAMKFVGQTVIPLLNGVKAKLKDILRASIPLATKEQALSWLKLPETGGGPLVKQTIIIRFGMGEEAWARKFARDLGQRKKPVDAEFKEEVHPSSLTKFVKEKKAAGKPVDTSISVFEATVAEIERPKDGAKPVEGM